MIPAKSVVAICDVGEFSQLGCCTCEPPISALISFSGWFLCAYCSCMYWLRAAFCALKPDCACASCCASPALPNPASAAFCEFCCACAWLAKLPRPMRLVIVLLLRGVLEARALRRHVHHALLFLPGLADSGKPRVGGLPVVVVHRRLA